MEKLKKLLALAEKYGAEVAFEVAQRGEGCDTPNNGSDIADLINNGTDSMIKGKEQVKRSDGSIMVDPFTDLPM